MASKSFTEIERLVAIPAVPAFPGATNNFEQRGLCEILYAKGCSRPPDPHTRIFIVKRFVSASKIIVCKLNP